MPVTNKSVSQEKANNSSSGLQIAENSEESFVNIAGHGVETEGKHLITKCIVRMLSFYVYFCMAIYMGLISCICLLIHVLSCLIDLLNKV